MEHTNLTDQLLIAMPTLKDPGFEKTVTYICAHNEEGAMGIVINKPLDIELGDIFAQMEIRVDDLQTRKQKIYHGGPVYTNRGFILHHANQEWESSVVVSDDICVTTSKDILEAIATGAGPDESLIALGYAGWAGGQLEREILENAWLNGPSNRDIIFNTPFDKCWEVAVDNMGIDIEKLSSEIGHA